MEQRRSDRMKQADGLPNEQEHRVKSSQEAKPLTFKWRVVPRTTTELFQRWLERHQNYHPFLCSEEWKRNRSYSEQMYKRTH